MLDNISGLDSAGIIALKAKNLTSTAPTEHLDGVLDAYSGPLPRTHILHIAAWMAFLSSLGIERRRCGGDE